MPEATSNIEFAQRIHERAHKRASLNDRRAEWVEIARRLCLRLSRSPPRGVAIRQQSGMPFAPSTTTSRRTTVISQEKATLAGQDRLYNITQGTS
jgi:hypothetical protein